MKGKLIQDQKRKLVLLDLSPHFQFLLIKKMIDKNTDKNKNCRKENFKMIIKIYTNKINFKEISIML